MAEANILRMNVIVKIDDNNMSDKPLKCIAQRQPMPGASASPTTPWLHQCSEKMFEKPIANQLVAFCHARKYSRTWY